VTEYIARLRRDADQYQRQVEEARRLGTPWEQQLSIKTTYRECATNLERILTQTTANE
jgi:hypothetical protein